MDKEYTLSIMNHFKAKKRKKNDKREVSQFELKTYKANKRDT